MLCAVIVFSHENIAMPVLYLLTKKPATELNAFRENRMNTRIFKKIITKKF